MLKLATENLEAAQTDIELLRNQQEYYKAEADKSMGTIEDLMKQIKEDKVALVRSSISFHHLTVS